MQRPRINPGNSGTRQNKLSGTRKTLALRVTCACGILALTTSVSPGEQTLEEVPSRIASVMIAGGQALVSRTGKMSPQRGKQSVLINNLPAELIDNSVRFSLQNTKDKILDFRIEQITKSEIPDADARKAEDDLRTAQIRLRELTDEYKSEQELEGMIRAIGPDGDKKNDDKSDRLAVAQWRKTIAFIDNAITERNTELRSLKRQIADAEEDVQVALVVAERLLSKRSLAFKQVRITLQSSGETSDFTLNYRTPGAMWYPAYTVRVGKSNQDNVRLAAFGLVQNRTGEEWNNVKLQLSAADPEDLIQITELKEWRIRPAMVAEQSVNEDRRRMDKQSAYQANDMVRQEINRPASVAGRDEESPMPQRAQSGVTNTSTSSPGDDQPDAKPANELSKVVQNSKNTLKDAQGILSRTGDAAGILDILNNRDDAFKKGDYNTAAKYSEEFLDRYGKLKSTNQQVFFAEENKSRDIREKSMGALASTSSNLIAPRNLRGNTVYETQYAETIPSDGIMRKVSLFEAELSAQKIYEAVPVHQPFAYLTGRVSYKNQKPLLPGPAQVFHGDDFVGEAVLPETGTNQDIALALGNTEDIKITRTENRFRETAGIWGKDLVYKLEIQIKVHNGRGESVEMDVFDRIPRSEDERIKIKDEEFSMQPTERTPEGLLRYRLTIPAGKEASITCKYILRHPAGIVPSASESGPEM